MATNNVCILIALLSLHAAHSYILLTANLEDMHAIAEQIAASPLANQISEIIQRASSIFNQQVANSKMSPQLQKRSNVGQGRTDGNGFEAWKPSLEGKVSPEEIRTKQASSSEASDISDEDQDTEDNQVVAERRMKGDELVELGKNASFYLSSIKKIFENV